MVSALSRLSWALRLRAVWMLAFLAGGLLSVEFASGADTAWAKLLPKESAFVWHYGGSELHGQAFEKTAAFEAFFQSGLIPTFKKLAVSLPWKIIADEFSVEVSGDLTLQQVIDFYGFLDQRGFTFAVCLPEDDRGSWPYQLLVIPEAGTHGPSIGAWAETTAAASLAKNAAASAKDDAKTKKNEKKNDEDDEPQEKRLNPAKAKEIADKLGEDEPSDNETTVLAPILGFDKIQYKGRTIYRLHCREGHAKVVLACWQEDRDLMVYSGRPNVEAVIDKVTNTEEWLTTSRSWKRDWPELEQPFAETSHAWCDVARLLQRYGSVSVVAFLAKDVSEPITIAKLLKPFGLDNVESVAWRWGYHGRHLVDVLDVVTPEPHRGLLALYDQPSVSVDRLPPLPVSVRSFSIQSFDAARAWDQSATILTGLSALLPEELNGAIRKIGSKFENENAAELRRELFASLGNVLCTWSDTDQELLSLGRFNLAISVKDAPSLQKTLDRLFELIQQQGVEFSHTAGIGTAARSMSSRAVPRPSNRVSRCARAG